MFSVFFAACGASFLEGRLIVAPDLAVLAAFSAALLF